MSHKVSPHEMGYESFVNNRMIKRNQSNPDKSSTSSHLNNKQTRYLKNPPRQQQQNPPNTPPPPHPNHPSLTDMPVNPRNPSFLSATIPASDSPHPSSAQTITDRPGGGPRLDWVTGGEAWLEFSPQTPPARS